MSITTAAASNKIMPPTAACAIYLAKVALLSSVAAAKVSPRNHAAINNTNVSQ